MKKQPKNYKGILLSPPQFNYKLSKNIKLKNYSFSLCLAHSDLSGHNVCPMANRITKNEDHERKSTCSSVCVAVNGNGRYKSVMDARIKKTKRFFEDRSGFMTDLVSDIRRAIDWSTYHGYTASFRLNAYSDIRWETIIVQDGKTIFDLFPETTFYDYTKLSNRVTPDNYELTYSHYGQWDETRKADAKNMNIAMVFEASGLTKIKEPLPTEWHGKKVIDGDETDLRTRENDGVGVIVGLRSKMSKVNIAQALNTFVVPNDPSQVQGA